MGKYDYSIEVLSNAVKKSDSIAKVFILLGIPIKGGNYRTIQKKIKDYNLDTSHFKGQSWSKDKVFGNKYPIEDYLSNSRFISSDSLKKRLLKEGYFEYKCCKCKRTKWYGEEIPLELHHIDENHDNNNLSNLTILCPNCHTVNHKKNNKQKKEEKKKLKRKNINEKKDISECDINATNKCIVCNNPTNNPKYCSYYCLRQNKRKVKDRPTKEELQKLLETLSYVKVGKMFGVSDNAVRKWLK